MDIDLLLSIAVKKYGGFPFGWEPEIFVDAVREVTPKILFPESAEPTPEEVVDKAWPIFLKRAQRYTGVVVPLSEGKPAKPPLPLLSPNLPRGTIREVVEVLEQEERITRKDFGKGKRFQRSLASLKGDVKAPGRYKEHRESILKLLNSIPKV